MIQALFNGFIKIILWLLGIIGSIIVYPIQLIFTSIIPGFDTFISVLTDFLTNTFFPMVSFCKEIMLDITCLPRTLWSVIVAFMFTLWGIAPAIRVYRLIVNMWKLKSGGTTSSAGSLVGKEFDL